MNTNEKRTYNAPIVECIEMDREISLILASSDLPLGDPESMMLTTDPLLEGPIP